MHDAKSMYLDRPRQLALGNVVCCTLRTYPFTAMQLSLYCSDTVKMKMHSIMKDPQDAWLTVTFVNKAAWSA